MIETPASVQLRPDTGTAPGEASPAGRTPQ